MAMIMIMINDVVVDNDYDDDELNYGSFVS